MRPLPSALAAALLCGCASTHNLATDGTNVFGGGYYQTKIRDGVYQVSVRTNWAPWTNISAARSSWRDRARELCGSEKFRELEIVEGSYDQLHPYMGLRYIVTTRDGFAVCDAAGLSDAEALALIHNADQPSVGTPIPPGHLLAGQLLNIRAPNSEGWQVLESDNGDIGFGKHAPAADETYAAQVLRFTVPESQSRDEFTAFMKEKIAKGMNPQRYDVLSMEIAQSGSRPYPCVSVEYAARDKKARTSPTTTEELLLQAISLYCRHPSQPGLGFGIIFSHRGRTLDPHIRQSAEDFIRNVDVPP